MSTSDTVTNIVLRSVLVLLCVGLFAVGGGYTCAFVGLYIGDSLGASAGYAHGIPPGFVFGAIAGVLSGVVLGLLVGLRFTEDITSE